MASKCYLEYNLICLEGVHIPHNKLGITDNADLHGLESMLLTEAHQIFSGEWEDKPLFDEDYFKSLHRGIFACLHDWVGAY